MRKLQYLFMALSAMFLAVPAFAQSSAHASATQTSTGYGLMSIAVGIGMGLASGMCGLGQGRATASATEALARNPGARAGILLLLVMGLAFMESLTLFTLVMVFLKINT